MIWYDLIWCWYYDMNVVRFDWCYLTISYLSIYVSIWLMILFFHERSYNENYTPSRPLWEVKSHLAWSVVRWVTTCEARVLFVLLCLFCFVCFALSCLVLSCFVLFCFVCFALLSLSVCYVFSIYIQTQTRVRLHFLSPHWVISNRWLIEDSRCK